MYSESAINSVLFPRGDGILLPPQRPLITQENVQNRPESEHYFGASWAFFIFPPKTAHCIRARRWCVCPVCRSTSRESGHSFLMNVVGRSTTSFAGNAKGAASRASVLRFCLARIINQKGVQRNERKSDNPCIQAGAGKGQRHQAQGSTLAVVSVHSRSCSRLRRRGLGCSGILFSRSIRLDSRVR